MTGFMKARVWVEWLNPERRTVFRRNLYNPFAGTWIMTPGRKGRLVKLAVMAGIFVATAASATIAAGSGATRAEATDGAAPATSCATTTACIEGDNTSTGPGVKGTSAKGNG